MKITLEIGQGLLKTSSSSKTAESYLRPAFQHAQQLDCWPLLALAMDLDCEMEYRIGLKEVAVNLQKDAFALRRKNMPKGMDPQWVVDQYRWLDVIRRVENIREKIIKDTKNTRIKLQHADDSFEENTEDNTDKPRDNEPLGWATWVVEPYNFFARSVYPTEIVEDDTSKRSPTRSDAGNDMVLGSPKSLVDITGDILADILDREDFRSPAQSPSSPGAADHSPM